MKGLEKPHRSTGTEWSSCAEGLEKGEIRSLISDFSLVAQLILGGQSCSPSCCFTCGID